NTAHNLDDLFADNDDRAITRHMAYYDATGHGGPDYDQKWWGGLVKIWKTQDPPEGADTVHGSGADTWWDPLPATTGHRTNDDAWVLNERLLFSDLAAVQQWWHDHRLVNGYFGGGGPDDVEFLIQAYYILKPFRHTLPALEGSVRSVAKTLLASPDVI